MTDYNTLLHIFLQTLLQFGLDFLQNHKWFVYTGYIVSDTISADVGTPQKAVTGPNNYKLMITDLNFDTYCAKYVGDTTVFFLSLIICSQSSLIMITRNGMAVNSSKTKEIVINFRKNFSQDSIAPICIDGNFTEHTDSFKLLGVFVSSDLTSSLLLHDLYLPLWRSSKPHVVNVSLTPCKPLFCTGYSTSVPPFQCFKIACF